jgi:hypothetical protein
MKRLQEKKEKKINSLRQKHLDLIDKLAKQNPEVNKNKIIKLYQSLSNQVIPVVKTGGYPLTRSVSAVELMCYHLYKKRNIETNQKNLEEKINSPLFQFCDVAWKREIAKTRIEGIIVYGNLKATDIPWSPFLFSIDTNGKIGGVIAEVAKGGGQNESLLDFAIRYYFIGPRVHFRPQNEALEQEIKNTVLKHCKQHREAVLLLLNKDFIEAGLSTSGNNFFQNIIKQYKKYRIENNPLIGKQSSKPVSIDFKLENDTNISEIYKEWVNVTVSNINNINYEQIEREIEEILKKYRWKQEKQEEYREYKEEYQEKQTRAKSSSSIKTPKEAYSVLGLDSNATKNDIKKRVYELVKKYHPDRNPNATPAQQKENHRILIEINAAYELLTK